MAGNAYSKITGRGTSRIPRNRASRQGHRGDCRHLALLHGENIAHRDVKPNNLYRYEGKWVISDLGLIDIPGGEPLTIGARALGPRYFLAPEMIMSPDRDDCRPADVYSLGKTLWCVLTGQNVPPPGEHRPDLPDKKITNWGVAHPRAHYLDRLIAQTSQEDPNARPTMSMVAETLNGWLAMPVHAEPDSDRVDIADVSAKIRDTLDTLRAPLDERNARTSQARALTVGFNDVLSQLLGQLNAARIPSAGINSEPNMITYEPFWHFADALPDDRVVSYIGIEGVWNNPPNPFAFLRTMIGACVAGDRSTIVAAAHAVSDKNGIKMVWEGSTGVALVGSSVLDDAIERLRGELIGNFSLALAEFLSSISS